MKQQDVFDDKFWSDRYEHRLTGWDLGVISSPLKAYFDQLKNKEISILIPGCGNAYEAEYLLNAGFTDVSLIDISKTLTDALNEKFKDAIKAGI